MRVLIVAPVAPPYGGMALQAAQVDRLLTGEGVAVTFLPSNAPLPASLHPLERLRGVRTGLRAIVIWFRLWRVMPSIDVVHIFAASWLYFFVVVYPAVIVGRIHRKRVLINYRGGEAGRFFAMFAWSARPAFRLATVVTAPSEYLQKIIQAHFDIGVSVVRNIVNSSAFEYRARGTFAPKLLVTRHLEAIYDVASIVKAFQIVQHDNPEASLSIVGSGTEGAELRRLVARLRLKNVEFLGEVAHRDLPAIYSRADIYVNASLVDNFPGALLEASAAGLPIVSTAAGGIPFIYEHGRTALLVTQGDYRGLAAAIEQILRHPTMAVEMAHAALALAQSCTWSSVREQLFGAYGLHSSQISAHEERGTRPECAAG
jgi:glycosyltransferase involved in cell wall biosynthesis